MLRQKKYKKSNYRDKIKTTSVLYLIKLFIYVRRGGCDFIFLIKCYFYDLLWYKKI